MSYGLFQFISSLNVRDIKFCSQVATKLFNKIISLLIYILMVYDFNINCIVRGNLTAIWTNICSWVIAAALLSITVSDVALLSLWIYGRWDNA